MLGNVGRPSQWHGAGFRRLFPVAAVCGAAFACVVLAYAVYWPRLHDYFVLDDFFFLRAVRNHSFPEVMLRSFTFPDAKPFDEITLFWRPLIDVYFYAFRIFGLDPGPYHAVNVGLHGAVGGLAVIFVWRLTGSTAAGAITGLLFVVVPTYDFAVTWVSEVSELLGAALMLGALLSYHAYLTADQPRPWHYRATLALTVLGLLSKESTIILFALLPALALAVGPSERRRTDREVVRTLALLLPLGAAFAAVMLVHQYQGGGAGYRLGWHMRTNVWDYLTWMVLPYRDGWAMPAREAAAATFLALGVLALLLRQRALAFFAFWTIVALLPFAGFDTGRELRYTYLATLPFAAFVVSAVVTLVQHLPGTLDRPAWALLGIAVLAALVVTPTQTRRMQEVLEANADGYEGAIEGVRTLCGDLAPGSSVYLLDPPYGDLHAMHTPSAVNLYYDHVNVALTSELPPLAAFVENKCVLQSTGDGYERVD